MDNIFKPAKTAGLRCDYRRLFIDALSLGGAVVAVSIVAVYKDLPFGMTVLGISSVITIAWLIRSYIGWKMADESPLASSFYIAPFDYGPFSALTAGDRFFVRYTIAVGLLFVAWFWYAFFSRGEFPDGTFHYYLSKLFVFSVPPLMVLGAAVSAYELSLFILGAGALYFAYTWVPSLSVSSAIVIGACTIALAIYLRGKRS